MNTKSQEEVADGKSRPCTDYVAGEVEEACGPSDRPGERYTGWDEDRTVILTGSLGDAQLKSPPNALSISGFANQGECDRLFS